MEMDKQKVYCKNCKYYKVKYITKTCKYIRYFIEETINPYNHVTNTNYRDSKVIIGDLKWNENGRCPKYIRKWWAFWIK